MAKMGKVAEMTQVRGIGGRPKRVRKRLGEVLIEQEVLTEAEIGEVLKTQKERGGPFGAIAVDLGLCTEEDILRALAEQAGMEMVNLEEADIAPTVVEKVSPSIANVYKIIPIRWQHGVLTVAMADPLNVNALDDLRFMLNCEVVGAVSNEAAVAAALDKYYADQSESIEDLLHDMEGVDMIADIDDIEGSIDLQSVQAMANSMPVVKLLNLVLLQAIKDQASDIHFEPFEDEFKIRYRVDGVLYEMMPPPRHLSLALTSRIKVMANMDIAESRVPQDNRIELNIGGNPIDLRVSTLPTMFGESVVMRVLDRRVVSLDLDRIGLSEDETTAIRRLIELPHGIILVTGPTGSGKTTTLYSCLAEANKVDVKIITTEDPVEYDLDGIMQVPINEEIGVTYAACLRSILRQDPDKILVGEIRDVTTAEIAVEAALTGHIVFSTLHTNDAPSTITRLVDMGVEPFLAAATLEAIIAQRLVRVICKNCKTEYAPTDDALMQLNLTTDMIEGKTFYYGKGCDVCNNTGYKGRTAIFEMMLLSEEVRNLVLENASTQNIRAVAMRQGMKTLRDSGLSKIYNGESTIEEIVRETAALDS